jgi:topoisomerase IV subunit B
VQGGTEAVDWALAWLPEGGEPVAESYVNLIPTAQGGTHVNGLRAGLTEALREFCEFRNLLPRGVKLGARGRLGQVAYVLSVKLEDPQFSGQTKERLSSRECAAFVSGTVKDALRAVAEPAPGGRREIAQLAIANASARLKASRKVVRKRIVSGPALPGKLADCTPGPGALRAVPGRGRLGRRLGQAGARPRVPGRDAAARQDPEHLGGGSGEVLASQEVHDISIALGVDPGLATTLRGCATTRSASSPTPTPTACTSPRCCARCSCATSRALVDAGHVFVAMPPLYRIDVGKQVFYALDDAEREACCTASRPRTSRQGHGHALQGPGRDEPDAAARDHDGAGDAPPGAADARAPRRRRTS